MTPTYVDPFLGAGAVWLALFNPALVPPVSWMGGKRRLARELLQLLDLVPGRPVASVVGDASWWGWVWQVVLDPDRGPAVSAWLRSWRGEPPRDLWFRLRAAGPPDDIVERAAGLLWLQARAASGVPVWWQDRLVSMDATAAGRTRRGSRPGCLRWFSTPRRRSTPPGSGTRPSRGWSPPRAATASRPERPTTQAARAAY